MWPNLGTGPILIGHRGFRASFPENTLISFVEAFRAGARMVECDVQLSRDGVPVVMHDEALKRTTGSKGKVSTKSWKALSKLDAGSWFSPRFASEKVPDLSQVLKLTPKDGLVYIEIKSFSNKNSRVLSLCDSVAKVVYSGRSSQKVLVASFDPRVFAYIKRAHPKLKTGLIFSDLSQLAIGKKRGFRYLDVLCPRFHLVTAKLMKEARDRGLLVFAWTARRRSTYRRLARLGVDGIAVDNVMLLKA